MAGNSDDISNASKPTKGTTEKKKRKRPSKKVPTTVLQANSSGFMNLVQKLTGSAEEIAAAESNNLSPHQSPYSSPSNQPETTTTTYHSTSTNVDMDPSHGFNYSSAAYPTAVTYPQYQQYHEPPATSNYGYRGGYVGSGSRSYGEDVDSNSYGYRGSGDPSDRFSNDNSNNNSSPSSSRGMDVSPFSRYDHGNHNSSAADYYCTRRAARLMVACMRTFTPR